MFEGAFPTALLLSDYRQTKKRRAVDADVLKRCLVSRNSQLGRATAMQPPSDSDSNWPQGLESPLWTLNDTAGVRERVLGIVRAVPRRDSLHPEQDMTNCATGPLIEARLVASGPSGLVSGHG